MVGFCNFAIQLASGMGFLELRNSWRIYVELFNIGEWNLPKIKAGDDAEHCAWIPLSKLKREEIFEDHYDIITYFTKI